MKEVDLYSYCKYDKQTQIGSFTIILIYKKHIKVLESKEMMESGCNRLMIKGLIEGIKTLNQNCKISLYATAPIGITNIRNSLNRDLLEKLLEEIVRGNHQYKFTVLDRKTLINIKKISNENHRELLQ